MHVAFCCSLLLLLAPQQSTPEIEPTEFGKHPRPIEHLLVSRDGKTLYAIDATAIASSGESTSMLCAWDLRKEKSLWKVPMDMPTTTAAVLGKEFLVTSFGVGIATFNSLKDGESEKGQGGPNALEKFHSLAVDPKDRWVWMGSKQGFLIRITPGEINGWSRRAIPNKGSRCLAMGSKGKHLAVGGTDGSVRFANPSGANIDKKTVFQISEEPITALVYDPKNSKLIVGSEDGALCMINATRGKRFFDMEGHKAEITTIAVHPKSKWIASGDKRGVVTLWDFKSGDPVATLKTDSKRKVTGLAFIDKGKKLIGSAGQPKVLIWDLEEL